VRVILYTGKGGWQRAVAFNAGAKKALWRYMLHRPNNGQPWLWLTEEGKRLTWKGIDSAFSRIKVRAGVNGPGGVHKLRHTFAINALRGLKDPFLLQLLLGHKSLEMTRRYTQSLKVGGMPLARLQLRLPHGRGRFKI